MSQIHSSPPKLTCLISIVCLFNLAALTVAIGQTDSLESIHNKAAITLNDTIFQGIELRSIGPALMSGRIADIAIHPDHPNTWYIAVGSGGVWKTNNAGTTWQPLFDQQAVYSIGCIAIDPTDPHVIWVGTGENVGGRHVGFGDGIYRSVDGGTTWTNMGLKQSQHISKIIVHPSNSNIIWVAAQGPLWNKGGERGLYKTTNGGITWKKTLGDAEWIGVTDMVIDPRNPKYIYAATWQRHRTVAAYMGGGPGSGIHRSTDGGDTWEKLTQGLPTSNMGKIGLAISPQQPDVIYAAIELDRRKGGLYRSSNKGASWEKRSEAVSGATGPHYYQELYACPHHFDRIYLADVRMQVSQDGGQTFRPMKERHKHSDNHALAFRVDDPNYLMVGTDGGLYESFDNANNWRFVANLPVTQFYRLAVDDAEPFYNIYGGTQDNNTQGGPSRTDNAHGIRNADWYITLFADGHQPATEPGNPDIIYNEWQEGNLVRVDVTTGEVIHIQPQPEKGEPHERYNWDAPILVSPHAPTRLYFASQRVWQSDDRGNSWKAISGDLTRNQERMALPIMGSTQSWDNAWDMHAMSNYNTITSLAESPLQEGLIYAGTDDGLIQVTENSGEEWRKIEVSELPDVPVTAFVNDIKTDLFDTNTVYIALDNHKYGDFTPYLLKSADKGNSWQSIRGNLPDSTMVWRFIQDHEKAELCFAATEFGIYFTLDGGQKWIQLKGNVPTISFRDLAIQRRENDLIGASFGRGFYILDNYSLLREVTPQQLAHEATLFKPAKAWWYIPRSRLGLSEKGAMGADYFAAPNPPFGAVFNYYLAEGYSSLKQQRQKQEKETLKANKSVEFPGWEKLNEEIRQDSTIIWLTVTDQSGDVVRRIKGPISKGFHQVAWDLRYPVTSALSLNPPKPNEWYKPQGLLAAPGLYTATLAKQENGNLTSLSKPMTFEVLPMRSGALENPDIGQSAFFWRKTEQFQRDLTAVSLALSKARQKTNVMNEALNRSEVQPGSMVQELYQIRQELYNLHVQLNGPAAQQEVGEKYPPTVKERFQVVMTGIRNSTYGPTATHIRNLEIAVEELALINTQLKEILEAKLPHLEQILLKNGAPWVEGMKLPPLE